MSGENVVMKGSRRINKEKGLDLIRGNTSGLGSIFPLIRWERGA